MDISRFARLGIGRIATAAGLIATLLAGCAPTALLDAVTPTGNYRRSPDLSYGERPRQKLDVYEPLQAGEAQAGSGRPVVVFFYGGSWRWGSKNQYRFVAETLTRHGVVVVIADYRIFPEAAYPEFIDDGANALRWVRDHASEYGVDPERMFVMGHSAGA